MKEKADRIIGNGDHNSFWKCNWVPYKVGLRRLLLECINLELFIKDLWDQNKDWNEALIINTFNNVRDVESILRIYIFRQGNEDHRVC